MPGRAGIALPHGQLRLERLRQRQEPFTAGFSQEIEGQIELPLRLVGLTARLADRRVDERALQIGHRSAHVAQILQSARVSLGSRQIVALVGDAAEQIVRPAL